MFLHTPAKAGRYVEAIREHLDAGDRKALLEQCGWELLSPNPL